MHFPADLYVWVQALDICCNACNEATSTNGDKDGIKLAGVCDLQGSNASAYIQTLVRYRPR